MNYLDTNTDFYIGGVSSLSLVNPIATANEPIGFQGRVREVVINNQELTELGAKGGSNVGDCDGTACGYKVCRNGGECIVNSTTFSCRCLPHWAGNVAQCGQPVHCLNHLCLHQSLCAWPSLLLQLFVYFGLGGKVLWKQNFIFDCKIYG